MNREFLEFYNRELGLLREQAGEFAQEYPGVAERLGGLIGDRMDPMIGGLLEGAAFLAARVQLKIKHEFSDFTTNYIDQLAPNYLAPTPSALMVRASPKYGDPALREGRTFPRGAYFDATYRELERNVACRFRLSSALQLTPLEIVNAEYFTGAAPFQALAPAANIDAPAGLRVTFLLRTVGRSEDEPDEREAFTKPELQLASCRLNALRIHILGGEAEAGALYEQIFGHCKSIYFRHLDSYGDPVVFRAGENALRQIGFDEDDALIPNDGRLFRGFDFLRDYFTLARRFLGFEFTDLGKVARRIPAKSFDVLFAFDEVNPRLASVVRKDMLALHAAPAVNLFEKSLDRIAVRDNLHEFPVIPDRTRALDFEANRVLRVFAHVPGAPNKTPVEPLYSVAGSRAGSGLTYTVRRLPRRRSQEERRFGSRSDYIGTDMFVSLGEAETSDDAPRPAELSVHALCTNRHLTEHLPVGEGGADFRFLDDTELELHCVAGPTRPREPVMTAMMGRGDGVTMGEVAWRLINMLSLNHLGLVGRAAGEGARALRETVSLFADPNDSVIERRIRGLRSVDARPIVARVRHLQGSAVARGLEVSILVDDKAFEGSSAFLLGAVLDRFLAEYVEINHFTQTILRTPERGQIMRWPPRMGLRGVA